MIRSYGGLTPAAFTEALLPSGAKGETVDRRTISSNTGIVSGTLTMVAMPLRAGQLISALNWLSSTTALAGSTHQWSALFDSSRVMLAVSADDTAAANWSASTVKTFALSTPSSYRIRTTGLYYVGLLVVAGTVPTLQVSPSVQTAIAITPGLVGRANTGMTTPPSSPFTANALSLVNGSVPYAYAT